MKCPLEIVLFQELHKQPWRFSTLPLRFRGRKFYFLISLPLQKEVLKAQQGKCVSVDKEKLIQSKTAESWRITGGYRHRLVAIWLFFSYE